MFLQSFTVIIRRFWLNLHISEHLIVMCKQYYKLYKGAESDTKLQEPPHSFTLPPFCQYINMYSFHAAFLGI